MRETWRKCCCYDYLYRIVAAYPRVAPYLLPEFEVACPKPRIGDGHQLHSGASRLFVSGGNHDQALTYFIPEEVYFNRGGELGLN